MNIEAASVTQITESEAESAGHQQAEQHSLVADPMAVILMVKEGVKIANDIADFAHKIKPIIISKHCISKIHYSITVYVSRDIS